MTHYWLLAFMAIWFMNLCGCSKHRSPISPDQKTKIVIEASYEDNADNRINRSGLLDSEQTPASVAPLDVPLSSGYPLDANAPLLPPSPAFLPMLPFPGPADLREDDDENHCRTCREDPNLGLAAFSTTSPTNWYVIETQSYPTTTTLSLNRNNGYVEGGVALNPTGLTIEEEGTYWAYVTAVVLNTDPISSLIIPIFLIPNGIFDPANITSQIGSTATVPPNELVTIQASGILLNIEENTTFSIVATNGGNPLPQPLTVIAWGITVFKIFD